MTFDKTEQRILDAISGIGSAEDRYHDFMC